MDLDSSGSAKSLLCPSMLASLCEVVIVLVLHLDDILMAEKARHLSQP